MSMKKGDKVIWKSHGHQVSGTVEKKIMSRTSEAGRTVNASPTAPQYKVKSHKTGRTAVHKPEALKHGK
ncbi:DUF2945 domain-containing protein [Actinoplanes sp. NPDC051346]|uniref:DUF2945 domain-containing protein n=1 Tax=Actinoplanes sp. NPDC051346 TaxID=3155048 RepID=UPI003427157A